MHMVKVSEEHKKLYHYTSAKGLDGILKSQSLWATQYIYLNDEKEIKLFIEDELPNFIKPHIEAAYLERLWEDEQARNSFFGNQASLEEAIEHDSGIIGECLLNPLNEQIYICSFSGESGNENIDNHGQLSQWRAYGEDGGYCIVFNTKKLENLNDEEFSIFSHTYLNLCDVVYNDERQKYKDELGDSLEKIASFVKSMALNVGKNKKYLGNSAPFVAFVNCISRYKHFGFKEENEIRLVSVPDFEGWEKKKKLPRLIEQNGRKYIDLFSELKTKLPIEEIIVGPHKDKIERAKKLKEQLKDENIEVRVSEIPYVGRRNYS